MKIGVQIHPQTSNLDTMRRAWQDADAAGVDSIWTWDHFFAPLYGEPDDPHFECWSLLAAMATTTQRATIGALVSCVSYRNSDLVADMARTIDHLSGGRFVLGLGAGWKKRDYVEYGYDFGTTRSRGLQLREDIVRIRRRLDRLHPAPIGRMPILVGGNGPEITLGTVARHADAWNAFGTADSFRSLNALLDERCAEVGRNPDEIERTVVIGDDQIDRLDDLADAGAQHVILMVPDPYDLDPMQRLLERRERVRPKG